MNLNDFTKQWDTIKARAKAEFGRLTDDDLSRVEGRRDELVARYEIAKDEADAKVREFLEKV